MSKNTQLGNLVNGLYVDSTGKVGVGTQSPTGTYGKLSVAGGISLLGDNNAKLEVGVYSSGILNSYIKLGANSTSLRITNNNDSADIFTITNAGNVGIGTTTTSLWQGQFLQISNDLILGKLTVNGYSYLSHNVAYDGSAFKSINGGSGIVIGFSGADGFNIDLASGASSAGSSYPVFSTKFKVSSAGLVSINGTNDQERFRLQNTDSPAYLAFSEQNITMWRPNDSGSAFIIRTQAISGTWTGGGGGIEFRPLNTLRMTIGPTGNIGAPSGTNIYNASDARLKQNISQITYGLDAIASLNPVKFNWVDGFEPSEDGKDMLGFVAQEVLEVLPEAVEAFGTNSIKIGDTIIENPLRVNEKFIIPVLVKAIQELKGEIEILKNK